MPNIYGSTGDGYATSNAQASWETARNHAGITYDNNNSRDSAPILLEHLSAKGGGGTNTNFRRAFMYFDTSGISVTPSEATLKIRGYANGGADVIAVRSTAADPIVAGGFNDLYGASTALGNSDGSGAGTLAGVSGLTYSSAITSWDTSAYNNIALNSTALADMVSLDDFKICLMDYDYDYLDISPTPNFEQMTGLYWSEGVSESLHPYIDYTVVAAAADNAIFFGSNF